MRKHEEEGDHTGSLFADNTIIGGGKMDIGLSLGIHPWFIDRCTQYGKIRDTKVGGAAILVQIDGYFDGEEISGTEFISPPDGDFELFGSASSCRSLNEYCTIGDTNMNPVFPTPPEKPCKTDFVLHNPTCTIVGDSECSR
jgi:hypothetical protein